MGLGGEGLGGEGGCWMRAWGVNSSMLRKGAGPRGRQQYVGDGGSASGKRGVPRGQRECLRMDKTGLLLLARLPHRCLTCPPRRLPSPPVFRSPAHGHSHRRTLSAASSGGGAAMAAFDPYDPGSMPNTPSRVEGPERGIVAGGLGRVGWGRWERSSRHVWHCR